MCPPTWIAETRPACRRSKEEMVSDDQTRRSSGRAGASLEIGHDLEGALRRQIAEALQPTLDQLRQQVANTSAEGGEADDDGRMDGEVVEGRPPGNAGEQLGDAIRQQIAEALQPALDQFREQTVATVRHELDRALQLDGSQVSDGPRAAERDDRDLADRGSSEDEGRRQPTRSRERPTTDDADRRRDGDRAADESPQDDGGAASRGLQLLTPLLSKPMVKIAIALVEQQGEEWLRAQFKSIVEALFSESRREQVQRRVEDTLFSLLRASLEIVPDRGVRRELLEDAEETLGALIEDTFAKVFAGSAREDLERHGEKAIHALVHRDLPEALQEGTQALEAIIRGLVKVVEEHWEQVIQLFVQTITRVLQERIGSMLKESFAALTSAPKKEAQEKGDAVQEQVRQRGTELRDALAEAVESLQERVAEGASELQDRLKEGLESAAEDTLGGAKQPGRPPSGRPPSGRPPSGRPPSGRPPSAQRATPGRAPSARSR